MQKEQYSKEFGGTAGCTFRLAEQTAHSGAQWTSRKHAKEDGKKEIFKGDSWFSSVPVVMGLTERGHEYVGALKTNHALYPKEGIELIMKEWPSGSYTVWKCQPPGKDYSIIGIGYKYNARKVLCFVATRNAGSTTPGKPYVARFNDAAGNVSERHVPRPDILSKYFGQSNVVDAHNQARQSCLALEKRWITQDPWFRIATTLFGMTVTDCWKAYKYHVPAIAKKTVTLVEFADRLAYDCIYNRLSTVSGGGQSLLSMVVDVTVDTAVEPQVSPLTVASFESIVVDHQFVDNTEMEHPKNAKPRPKRRTCNYGDCKKQTQELCDNYKCRARHYNVNGKDVYGYFFCSKHQHSHWSDIAAGRIDV